MVAVPDTLTLSDSGLHSFNLGALFFSLFGEFRCFLLLAAEMSFSFSSLVSAPAHDPHLLNDFDFVNRFLAISYSTVLVFLRELCLYRG